MNLLSIFFAVLCLFFSSEEQGIRYLSFSEESIIYGINTQELCFGIWQGIYVTSDLQGEDLLAYLSNNLSVKINGSEIPQDVISITSNLGNTPEYDIDGNLIGSHTGYLIVCIDKSMFLNQMDFVEFTVPDEFRNNPSLYWVICDGL